MTRLWQNLTEQDMTVEVHGLIAFSIKLIKLLDAYLWSGKFFTVFQQQASQKSYSTLTTNIFPLIEFLFTGLNNQRSVIHLSQGKHSSLYM